MSFIRLSWPGKPRGAGAVQDLLVTLWPTGLEDDVVCSGAPPELQLWQVTTLDCGASALPTLEIQDRLAFTKRLQHFFKLSYYNVRVESTQCGLSLLTRVML